MKEALLVQFRLVVLDNKDNVEEVVYESEEHKLCDGWNSEDEMYHCLLTADERFDFDDYENVPLMEFQGRERGSKEWKYLSDPIEDWFNL